MSGKDTLVCFRPRVLCTQTIIVQTQTDSLHNRQCAMTRTRSIVYITLFSCSSFRQHSLQYRMFHKIRTLFHRWSQHAHEKVIWAKLSLLKNRRFHFPSYVTGN